MRGVGNARQFSVQEREKLQAKAKSLTVGQQLRALSETATSLAQLLAVHFEESGVLIDTVQVSVVSYGVIKVRVEGNVEE